MTSDLNRLVKQTLVENSEEMITEIERLIDEDGVGVAAKIGRTQFEAIMKNASHASCVSELCLFISYQESKRQGWDTICRSEKVPKSRRSVAENVIGSMNTVVDKIYNKIKGDDALSDERDIRRVKIQIAEKYLGYLYWKITVISQR